MKIMKKLLCLLLIAAFFTSLAGCSSLSVNSEKDKTSVVAVIDGQNIVKQSYKDYLTFTYILYLAKDYTLPSTDAALKTFKQDNFDDYINYLLYRYEAQSLGLSADDAKIAVGVDELMAEIKTKYPVQADYDKVFSKYGTTEAEFRINAFEQLRLIEYFNLYSADQKNFALVTEATALTVNNVDIPNYTFYYYIMTLMFNNYVNNSTQPENEKQFLALFDDALTNLAKAQANIAYCEKNNIVISDEDSINAMSYVNSVEGYLASDVTTWKTNFFISDEQWASAKSYMGKALAAQSKIEEATIAALNPSDSELKSYYNKNKNSFDTSTVKAYHILTTDKTVAQKLETEAGGTAEGFMAVYNKYQGDSTITEASDLGEFKKSDMVTKFADAAFSMKAGEVKGMVQTEYGYHLIYVYEANTTSVPTFEDIKEEVKTAYIASVKETKIEAAITKIYRAAKVKKGDYKKLPLVTLIEKLKKKYNVKTYEGTAVR